MHKKNTAVSPFALLLALLLAAAALPAAAQSTMTPRQQEAHDRAKEAARNQTQAGGLLNGLVGERGRRELPNGADAPPPGAQASSGITEALVTGCWRLVTQTQMGGEQLSNACEPAIRGAGLSSNSTNEYARLVEELCFQVWRDSRALDTRLHHHCMNLLAAKEMALRSIAQREQSLAASGREVTVDDRTRPHMTQDQIRDSYSACSTESREVAPATFEERVCESSRAASRGNTCAKTLTARVNWQCPAGAISGPTRVRAGTALQAGRYTCEVQVPRNVYSCPGGSTGPTNLAVPPGTQPEPACRRTGDGTVFAATLTVVQDIETRDATHTVTDEWSSGCAGLESNTPLAMRTLPFGGSVGPMAPFDASPDTQRCRLTASTCRDPAAGPRLVNDVPVSRACWAYNESFDCLTTTVVDDCEGVDASCTLASEDCVEWDNHSAPASCIRREVRHRCQIAPPVMRDVTSCANQTYCPGGGACWDTGYEANTEFGEVISLFSMGQQAARYFNANDFEIFKGYSAACARRTGLVINCCRDNWFGDLLFDALHAAEMFRPPDILGGGDLDEDKSQLFNDKTYDMLFYKDSTGQLAAGMRAVSSMKGQAGEAWDAVKDKDWKKVARELFLDAPRAVARAIANSTIDHIVNMTTIYGLVEGCTEDDQLTREKRKKHLCVDVGSHCNIEVPLTDWCWEREYRSCCFNSLLAKLINDQGRAQLMRRQIAGTLSPPDVARSLFPANASNVNQRFGTGSRPNCLGFSLDQFRLINFAEIDLTPFLATINPTLPNRRELVNRLEAMYRNCPGGVGMCDGNTPESQALDDDPRLGAADRNGNAVPRQLLSLKPLMRQAFPLPYGQAAGPAAINSEDWRQLRNYRFREGEPPVTATVTPLRPHPQRQDCKIMQVDVTRARVTHDYQEFNAPVTDENGTVRSWRRLNPSQTHTTDSSRNQNGGMYELPSGWRGGPDIPETTMRNTVSYCADGTVPGVTGP
jgi:conjugal transfer mating pair stabilization protein TraN